MTELAQLLPLIGVFLLIYLLMIRPGIRRNRELAALQGAIEPGDRVMLSSGFFGTVRSIGEESLEIELAEGVVVSVARGAVARRVESPVEETPAEETPADETAADETPADETPADETPRES